MPRAASSRRSRMRILIADDHAIVRRGLEMVLRLEKDFEVVGDAANGEQAVKQVAQFRPDVVLLDLKMPLMNGIGATREIKRQWPQTRVLILTGIEAEGEIVQALEAG